MKKIIKILMLGLFIILYGIGYCLVHLDKNVEAISKTKSLITLQSEYEKDFKISGYTIENPNIILDPYHASPLTALVLFETETKVPVTVTIFGKDSNTTYTHTFDSTTKHYLPIYGLYADQKNKVLIEYQENNKTIQKEITIQTEKLPNDLPLPTSVQQDRSKLGTELYFYTPSTKGYSVAYDVNGDVRWYLSNYALWDNTRLKNGHMLVSTERLLYNPYYMTGLYEIDLLGKIYTEYSLKGGYHHDYFELPNGNLLVASNDFDNNKGTVEDYIVELNRKTGKIEKIFDLKDILKMDDAKSENWSEYDWFHNNSVWYDEKTNSITLSGRHQDVIINIDYDTKQLNWMIGDSTNWSEEYQKYFFHPIGDLEWQWSQHAAMITPEGYVFVFDNGNNKSKNKEEYVDASHSYSRGVLYKIDSKNMTIEQIWQYGKERGSSFYSPYISDVDYIEKNHYIVHSGGIVSTNGVPSNQPAGLTNGNVELKSDTVELYNNEIIFELVLPTNNYRVEKMNLYNDTTLELKKAKKIGTLGETRVDQIKYGLISKAKKIDTIYQSHQIEFSQEEDRFIFEGQFKKDQSVFVILSKNLTSKYYNVPISKKPYTALCVDIFTEEENENGIFITKYINSEGLKGKYSIYVQIDGVFYQTEKYVEFD